MLRIDGSLVSFSISSGFPERAQDGKFFISLSFTHMYIDR